MSERKLNGKLFSSTYQPERRGRKKSILSKLRDKGMSAEDCKIWIQYLFGLPREEVSRIASDTSTPIFQAVIAKNLSEGSFKALMELLRFTYGNKIEIEDVTQTKQVYSHQEIATMFQEMKNSTK